MVAKVLVPAGSASAGLSPYWDDYKGQAGRYQHAFPQILAKLDLSQQIDVVY
jgi:hypothetical protein